MPALRTLDFTDCAISDAAAAALFPAAGAAGALNLRALSLVRVELSPAAVHAIVATGWRLDELDLSGNPLGADGCAALLAAPSLALRVLRLEDCDLDAATFVALANAPWPLEELDVFHNDLGGLGQLPGASSDVAAALVALSKRPCMRALNIAACLLTAASFKALAEASWPALVYLNADCYEVSFEGPDALGAAAFAGFPALEELDLSSVELGEAGARLLASRRWPRLKKLCLLSCALDDAALAALARGAWPALKTLYLGMNRASNAGHAALARGDWPALEALDLGCNHLSPQPTLEDVRRWAPALVKLTGVY